MSESEFLTKSEIVFFLRMNDFLLLDLKLDPRVNKNPSGVKNVVEKKLEIKNLDYRAWTALTTDTLLAAVPRQPNLT